MAKILSQSAAFFRSRRRYWCAGFVLIIYALPLLVFKGFGAFDAFLKIEGIDGEATNEKHKDWIEVQSFSWGMSRTGTSPGGGTLLKIESMQIVKNVDKSTPKLFLGCCTGEHYPTAVMEFTRPIQQGGQTADQVYLKYELRDCMISGYSISGNMNALPVDQVSLNFTKITMTYIPYDSATGNPGAPVVATCDFASLPQQ
jgi:type VI secretion system secreted protein Hcp